jgi:formamidopyrimidine-DNA glycosylase
MPELPEVETMRRGIAGVVGSRILSATPLPCQLRPIRWQPRLDLLRRRCRGRKIEDITRLGKRVVLRLENECRLVFEPRMTGLVLVADPPNETHLRFRIVLEGGPHMELLYWDRRGLGGVACWTRDEWHAYLARDHVGPDALTLTLDELQSRLGSSRRAIKVALLDQRAIAGIGNLYASEILLCAGIHPARPCSGLTAAEWGKIHRSQMEVLEEAIRCEGSTLSDGTYRNALNRAGGYQNHHRVYGRAGELCRACRKAQVVRIVQAQRATFFCPRCQPLD